MALQSTPLLRIEAVEVVTDATAGFVLVMRCCEMDQPWKPWTIKRGASGQILDVVQEVDRPLPPAPPPLPTPRPRATLESSVTERLPQVDREQ